LGGDEALPAGASLISLSQYPLGFRGHSGGFIVPFWLRRRRGLAIAELPMADKP
jgi:hypothetical protein